jgi:NAD-dependent protein deacetylase/lipoamidase
MSEALERAADAIRKADKVIALTGAGISVESGIPSFRDDGGIWKKYPPEEFATIEAYRANPDKVWALWCELGADLADCLPHPGHVALADLERMGRLHTIVTQNVDNLHQEAGSRNVIEYHGNARRLVCLACRRRQPFDLASAPDSPPHCSCGGLMKPDVVMFGELIPKAALFDAHHQAESCDVLIVVGTSAQVYPAAELPFTAQRGGAFIIDANTEETDFTHSVTGAFLAGEAGKTLPQLVQCVRG